MRYKVLLIGDFSGSYRSQNLVKIMLDQKHSVGIASRRYYFSIADGRSLKSRFFTGAKNVVANILFVVEVFVKAAFSDILFLLPMSNTYVPIAYLAKVIFHKPLVSELYVSIFDTGRDRGWYKSEKSLKARVHRLLDRTLIEKSDVVIHVSAVELEYIAGLVGANIDLERVQILPLAVDAKGIASAKPSTSFRVCWWGTFIPLHGLERIITAAKILVNMQIDIHFDLFGLPGLDARIYEKMVEDLGLQEYVGIHMDKSFLNGQLEPTLLTDCDLALGNFGESEKAHKVIVNKIIDAFAMGLPVLTMDTPALSEFIDIENELFVCKNTPEGIAEAIQRTIEMPQERARRAIAGRIRYQNTFTVQHYSKGVRYALEKAAKFS